MDGTFLAVQALATSEANRTAALHPWKPPPKSAEPTKPLSLTGRKTLNTMRSIPTGLGERKQLHASPRIGTSPRACSTPTGMGSASGPPPPPPCARAWRTIERLHACSLRRRPTHRPMSSSRRRPPRHSPRHPTRRRRCPSSRGRPSPPPGLRRRRGARADAGGGDERAAGAARAVRRTGGVRGGRGAAARRGGGWGGWRARWHAASNGCFQTDSPENPP